MSCSSPAGQQAGSQLGGGASSPSAADPATNSGCPDAKLSPDEEFFMFQFKVLPCTQTGEHCQEECPFAHPGEKATRRDPRVLGRATAGEASTPTVVKWKYSGISCPSYRKGSCKDGDACQYAHGVFEVWLHPSRFRTELCKDGLNCSRKCCFFAHTPQQLRQPPPEDPSVQALAQKAAQRAALVSRSNSSNSSNSSSSSMCGGGGLKPASSTASCDSGTSMLRAGAGVRRACSPANNPNGPGAARKSLPTSRTSTPAHGSCSSLQQLEALSGLPGYDAVTAAGAAMPRSRLTLQQAGPQHGAPITASSASRTLFDLPPPTAAMAAFGSSAGLALQQPTPAQLLPAAAVGPLQGLAGQRALGHCRDGILAGNLQPAVSAGLLGGLPGTCLGSHSSTAGFAASAALEILAAQQQDLATACALQQMLLLEAQRQQQMLQAAQQLPQQAQVSPRDHIFQMWASAYNAAKAVGLQAHEAAACADCAVEQTAGSLAPQLVPTATSAAGCAGSLVGGPFGAHPGAGAKDGLGPLLGASAQLQAGFQPMLALHSAPDLKQVGTAGVLGAGVVAPHVVGHLTGDMLAGLIPGLSL